MEDKSINDEIDWYIQNVITQKQISGMSVAVVKEGEPLLAKGYGIANLEHSVAATEKNCLRGCLRWQNLYCFCGDDVGRSRGD